MKIVRTAALAAAAAAGALALTPAAAMAAPAQHTPHHWHHHHHHHGVFYGGDYYGGPQCYRGNSSVTQTSAGNFGLLNGNQLALPINLGLDVSHNGLGILGLGSASGDDYC